jgi:RND superfamily putative drug exporter
MLNRIAQFSVRRRRLVLVLAALFMVLAGGVGGGVAKILSNGGFDDPGSQAIKAKNVLLQRFGSADPNLVLLVTAKDGSVDSTATATAATALEAELKATAGVDNVASYWSLGSPPPLKSTGNNQALIFARLTGSDDAVRDRIDKLSPGLHRDTPAINVAVTGEAEVFRQVGSTVESDLQKAEAIAVPITMVLLVVIFGSVVAASLPLAVGAFAVLGTFLILRTLAEVTTVSIFALNLTTALGLGLAIDYSLFIVSRFREELAHGHDVNTAVIRTVRTAGRTVLFSAATVAISLSALLVFPQAFLRSFAYAGTGVALTAAVGSIVVLPALLAVIGRRVDSWALPFRKRTKVTVDGEGFWHRMAIFVMRRPVSIATAVTALLLLLGAPFLNIHLSLSDHRVLPAGTSSRTAQEAIAKDFTSRESGAAYVIGDGATVTDTALNEYASRLSTVTSVARVDARTGSFIGGKLVAPPNAASARFSSANGTWLSVVPSIEPVSPAGETMVKAIRDTAAPFKTIVGGPSAQLVDAKASIFARLPWAGLIIATVTFVVLFLLFGGLLVPFKALILNILSLSATFGAMVWIFQEGHLSGFFNFTATGTIDDTMPILMFCIAFGLSMDYEVFLLSRIKEEHDKGSSNEHSVAVGLEKTGAIVTAAAVLIAVVFLAFATSGVTFIKLFGLGLAIAVLMDAFLIRATLVPAFMRLAGDANWWAPGPLRRFHNRFGISEHDDLDDSSSVSEPNQPKPELIHTGA